MARSTRTHLALTLAAALLPGAASAQTHAAHQTPADPAGECLSAQSKVAVTAAAARDRLEAARQTNEPAQLRAAVDEAMLALSAMLAATEPCRQAPPASIPHAAHTIDAGVPVAPPSTQPEKISRVELRRAPPKPATKPAPRAAAPSARPSRTPAATATKVAQDPAKLACTPRIDPGTAPSTTYKGKTYYFCTAAERLRFIQNPETYLKDAGGQ